MRLGGCAAAHPLLVQWLRRCAAQERSRDRALNSTFWVILLCAAFGGWAAGRLQPKTKNPPLNDISVGPTVNFRTYDLFEKWSVRNSGAITMIALTRSTNVTRPKRVSDYHVRGHTRNPERHSSIVGYRLWLLYNGGIGELFFSHFDGTLPYQEL